MLAINTMESVLETRIYNCETDFCPTCIGDYYRKIGVKNCRDHWEDINGKCYSYEKKIESFEDNPSK